MYLELISLDRGYKKKLHENCKEKEEQLNCDAKYQIKQDQN